MAFSALTFAMQGLAQGVSAAEELVRHVYLGDFRFDKDDLPEEMTFGGEQMLAVMKFPGGHKEVQSFGAQDRNISWSGTFMYENALEKLRKLDAMYRSGNVFELSVGVLMPRKVVIKKFEWRYVTSYELPYEIELEIAPTNTNLQSATDGAATPAAGGGAAPSGARTYTVVERDTLWGIAHRFYGDGNLYNRIAEANKIQDPNRINVGQQLVIP